MQIIPRPGRPAARPRRLILRHGCRWPRAVACSMPSTSDHHHARGSNSNSIPFHSIIMEIVSSPARPASRRLHGVPKLLTYFSLAIHGSVDRSRQAASKYSTVYSVYSIDDLMQVVVPSATLLALTTIKQPSLCYSHAADKANPNQSYI
jgi:hypothetical protein